MEQRTYIETSVFGDTLRKSTPEREERTNYYKVRYVIKKATL